MSVEMVKAILLWIVIYSKVIRYPPNPFATECQSKPNSNSLFIYCSCVYTLCNLW